MMTWPRDWNRKRIHRQMSPPVKLLEQRSPLCGNYNGFMAFGGVCKC